MCAKFNVPWAWAERDIKAKRCIYNIEPLKIIIIKTLIKIWKLKKCLQIMFSQGTSVGAPVCLSLDFVVEQIGIVNIPHVRLVLV